LGKPPCLKDQGEGVPEFAKKLPKSTALTEKMCRRDDLEYKVSPSLTAFQETAREIYIRAIM
jgi:hypothetical protein